MKFDKELISVLKYIRAPDEFSYMFKGLDAYSQFTEICMEAHEKGFVTMLPDDIDTLKVTFKGLWYYYAYRHRNMTEEELLAPLN